MNWLSKLFQRAPDARVGDLFLHQPNGLAYLPPVLLKPGKWVMTDQGVGIVTGISSFPFATVMLTDEVGGNVREINSPVAVLRIALREEIPQPRRPDATSGAALGYY